jgi:hypothetical protein
MVNMRGSTWSLRWYATLAGLLLLAACSSKGAPAAPAGQEQGTATRLEIRDELRLGVVRHSRERAREVASGKGSRVSGRHAEARGGNTDSEQ